MLHHIPVDERIDVIQNIYKRLRNGGKLYIIEHNMRNPVTKQTVGRCSFDDDAVMLSCRETERLLHDAGFEDIHSRYIVFFPKKFAGLRFLDRGLGWLPLGAQFLAAGKKPLAD